MYQKPELRFVGRADAIVLGGTPFLPGEMTEPPYEAWAVGMRTNLDG